MNWGWDKVIDLNVKGMFYLTRECIPLLENSSLPDSPSRIINIGSVAGMVPQEAPTHAYDVSKAAVHHLTRKFSADLARKNITVNAVAPGYVPSRMSRGLEAWGADNEKISSGIPLGRMGNEDDMAGACIYLSSKAGAWVTGVILTVDGGAVGSMQIPLSSL
jgi:NAD(P)-dependent dehydrogenase (short-subunit alcohol dehydrogenase family)